MNFSIKDLESHDLFHIVKKYHFGIDNLTDFPLSYYEKGLSLAKNDFEKKFFEGAIKEIRLFRRGYLRRIDL